MFGTALVALAAASGESGAEIAGYAEVRGQALAGVDGVPVAAVERFRPTLGARLGERLFLSSTVELGFAEGRRTSDEVERTLDEAGLSPLLDAAGCSFPEPENDLLGVSTATDYLRVERLYLDAYLPFADVRVGRQAIHWGSALLVNPTDPLPEVLLTEPWRERAGVNAARVTVPLGELSQIQAVAAANDAFTSPRLALRASTNAIGADFALSGSWLPDDEAGLVGLDIKGTAVVGYWVEGALHLGEGVGTGGGLGEDIADEVAVGIDYSFPVLQALVVSGQYYRNDAAGGTGTLDLSTSGLSCSDPDLLAGKATSSDPFASSFTSKDYGLLSVSLGVTPDLSVSAAWIQNFDDGTAMGVPTVSYAPPGRFEVAASAQIPVSVWGDGGEFRPSDDDLTLSVPGMDPVSFAGLVPDATFTVWTRLNL
jgi:hypothetical protein